MEGLFFLVDIICMLALGFAIVRTERSGAPEDLGVFTYKTDKKETDSAPQGERDA